MYRADRVIFFSSSFLALTWILSFGVLAQEGTITGRVTDPSGGVIPGVTLAAAQVETGIKTTALTNEEGYYAFSFLQPGQYQLSAEMAGFKRMVRPAIKLDVQQVLRIDFVLEVGELAQEVTVEVATPRLENETSSLGQVVENKTIVTLPINGRNYSQLALLTPGAVANPGSRAADGFSLNGNRTFQNTFLIDGVDNTGYILGVGNSSTQVLRPSIDAIQEFKVETANYSAEFGRAAGGVISVSLKSGTNDFHGSAFEFLRNDKLDANDFFSNRSGLRRPPLRYNQFGGTVGGPILRNRTFFFGSYQGTRIRQPVTVITTVPTPDMARGRFDRVTIYDPLNVVGGVRQPFPGNRIPEERLDPVGCRLAALYPAPNLPGEVDNYVSNVANKNDSGQYDGRGDHRISAKDQLFARYSHFTNELSNSSVFGPPGNGGATRFHLPSLKMVKTTSIGVNETHIFSSALVNEGRAGYTRMEHFSRSPAPTSLYEEFGLRGIPQFPGLVGLPEITVSGFSVLGDITFTPNRMRASTMQLVDNVSWVRGSHTVKLGGDLRFRKNGARSSNLARGDLRFSGQFTAWAGERGSGSALADLLLGQTSAATVTTLLLGDFRDHYYGFFVSDTWRASPRLTLNLGLRYELQTPMWERQNHMSNFDSDPRSPTFGILVPARNGSIRARTFANLDKNNLAPRVGFAYEVSPKTVVRGAFGIFYGGLGYQAIGRTGAANPPNFVSVMLPSPATADRSSLVLGDGFPAGILDPQNVRNPTLEALAAAFYMPEIYQWNLGLQREWLGDMVWSLVYVGSGSSRLRGQNDINAPAPGPGTNFNLRRPFPSFGRITLVSSFAHATYHALQAKAERRFRRGFSLLASYTWSHALDNAIDYEDFPLPGRPTYPQDPNNTRAEKSSSVIDVRHRFTSSIIYDLPIGRRGGWMGGPRVMRALLSGWQLGGIFVAQTGLPMMPTVNPNQANTTGDIRPDRLKDGNLPRRARSVDRWYDVAAFVPPAPFTFGNSGRSVLRAPGLVNLDLLLARNFPITEAKRLELRGEFFNFTNSVHFGQPGLTINQPQAGRITATQVPNRQVQIGLRFVF